MLCDSHGSHGARRTSGHGPAKGPALAQLSGHDHNAVEKGKKGCGSGLNAPSLVIPALLHPTARVPAGGTEGVCAAGGRLGSVNLSLG